MGSPRKIKILDSKAKDAKALNVHLQVIVKELLEVHEFDRVPLLKAVTNLFGIDFTDFE